MLRHAELHAAVLAAPDDDAPRLVYADWLLERGDARGELIALQVARAAMAAEDPRADALAQQERALLADHAAAWIWPWAGEVEYRRGFVERVFAHPIDLAPDLLADACVRELETPPQSGAYGALIPHLDGLRLRRLAVPQAAFGELAELLRAPAMRELEVLEMPASRSLPMAELLAAAVNLRALRELDVSACGLRPADIASLATWPHARTLRRLDLAGNRIGLGVLDGILDGPAFAALEHLDLAATSAGEEDVFTLCAAGLPLRALNLYDCIIGPAAARAIADAPSLARLARLNLAFCEIGEDGMAALIASPHLSRALELSVEHAVVTPALAARFRVREQAW